MNTERTPREWAELWENLKNQCTFWKNEARGWERLAWSFMVLTVITGLGLLILVIFKV